jgi:glycine/D-amino acid oxidase-like deaminating enzyme
MGGDFPVDVAVVGAGISGALMALALVRRGFGVAVLDRRVPLCGSTMASTALLQFEIDVSLSDLADRLGAERARRAWRRSVAGVQVLAALVKRERIRCGFAVRNSLWLAGDTHGARALKREAAVRSRAGIPGRFLGPAALWRGYAIDGTGAIESPGSAVADPAQLTAGILRRAVRQGAHVISPADVRDVSANRAGVKLFLADGHVVHAKDAVFCTGYEVLSMLPLDGHQLKSTWAFATHPVVGLPNWLRSTLVWEASDPYLYLRTTADDRLVAGGEDEDSATQHTNPVLLQRKVRTIAAKVQRLVPGLAFAISHRWAGAFGDSPTGLPLIGAVPGMPHCYTVAGFGGNGITYSVIAADVIGARLSGGRDADADLYRVPR